MTLLETYLKSDQAKDEFDDTPHLGCIAYLSEGDSKKEVSFRPEQDGFIVLRSGETPVFQDAGWMDFLTGGAWLFGKDAGIPPTPPIRLASGSLRAPVGMTLSPLFPKEE